MTSAFTKPLPQPFLPVHTAGRVATGDIYYGSSIQKTAFFDLKKADIITDTDSHAYTVHPVQAIA